MQLSKADRIRRIVGMVFLALVIIAYLLPYFWLIMSSFRATTDPFTASVIPTQWTLDNYKKVFNLLPMKTTNIDVVGPLLNSLKVSVVSTLLTMLLAITSAYGFSRFRFWGRSFLLGVLVNLRTFPGLLLAISLYVMTIRAGLYNTHLPLVLANSMLNLPFAIWNAMIVIDGISVEMEESGMVDGLSRMASLVRIVIPVAAPGLAATAIYSFILTWNEYMFATTFMSTAEMQLIPTTITFAVTQFGIDYGWLLTTAMVASFPIVLMFIGVQRFIVGGLAMGAVKG